MKIIGEIWTTVKGLITFVVHSIETLLYILQLIPTYLAALTTLIAEIPVAFQAIITASIFASIVYFIIGRNK